MFAFGKSPTTGQTWRESLARRLAWAFPEVQAREILTDYQDQFKMGKERGKSDSEIIEALGTPSEAIAQLLEEDPSARMELLRHCLLWGAALALCWAFVWLSFLGNMDTSFLLGVSVFLPVSTAVLFMLVRGPGRVTLEQVAAPEKRVSPVRIFPVPLVLMLVCLVTQEILVIRFVRFGDIPLKWSVPPQDIGPINVMALQLLALAMALLAAWMFFRSVTSSIRYFPGIAHAGGATFSALSLTSIYTAMDIETGPDRTLELQILLRLMPYLAGLVTARVFQHWVDGSKPLPLCFRDKNVIWADWRHRLAVSLLGWFSTEQSIEILEDYQEQFDLGQERGKSEEDLILELGRPETVIRDLLAEDRKARNRRRRIWPWAAMLAFAGWLLLGVLRAYEFDAIGVFYHSPAQLSMIALVLGTAALLVLLQVRSRAAVEARFPAQRKPAVWGFLVPPLAFVLTMGFALYLIQLYSFHWPVEVTFWGKSAAWYLADIIDFSTITLLFLLIWMLARCFSGSIRHLPAAIHIVGSLSSILCAGIFFRGMDIWSILEEGLWETVWLFSPVLLPYLFGAALALAVWLVIRFAGKPRKEG